MLKYYTHLYSTYRIEPIQTVLYIGQGSMYMGFSIEKSNLSFKYLLKDIKDIDCSELLNSDDLNDNILSVLCKTDDAVKLISEIRDRLSRIKNKNELEDYKLKLTNLLHLRPNLIKIVKEMEETKMPITINLKEDPFYLEGKAEGKAEGIAEGIVKGKAEGMSLVKRNYVVNSRKNLNLTPEQIASIINDTIENVVAILKEEGIE
ncbi:MAG: hypothetical protein M1502_02665 [Deltaproteobacteria bacterium]|nr:hypothetical protein [Deltaproteobacteria bacterium]